MKKSSTRKFLTLEKETLARLRGGAKDGLYTIAYPCASAWLECKLTPVVICDLK